MFLSLQGLPNVSSGHPVTCKGGEGTLGAGVGLEVAAGAAGVPKAAEVAEKGQARLSQPRSSAASAEPSAALNKTHCQ